MSYFRNVNFSWSENYELCSCGYCKKRTNYSGLEICPKCNSPKIEVKDTWKKSYKDNQIEFFKKEDKAFHVKKEIVEVNILKENKKPILNIKTLTLYEIDYDFDRPQQLILKEDGTEVKFTKTKLKQALSWIDIYDFGIFKEIVHYKNVSTAHEILMTLIEYPFLEIIYNTYSSLNMINGIDEKCLHNKTKPNEIVNLEKPIWNYLVNIYNEDNRCGKQLTSNFCLLLNLQKLYKNKPDKLIKLLKISQEISVYNFYDFCDLVNKYNFNMDTLYNYLKDDIYTYQGIDDSSKGLSLLKDYINMCIDMEVPFDKYPRSLKLAHDLMYKNYKFISSQEQIDNFNNFINEKEYCDFEWKNVKNEYFVLKPTCLQDIINEGRYLHHCVGAYANKIAERETKIYFLRKHNNVDKSLVTLEVKYNALIQARGNGNRDLNNIEKSFLKSWCKYKNIKFSI